MRIFVSCQSIDRAPASVLVNRLRSEGFDVEHSPSNPLDRPDPRWHGWYDSGLGLALSRCSAFVVVVDLGWDSSTWMAIEASLANEPSTDPLIPNAFFWNPEMIIVRPRGISQLYLKEELPIDINSVVSVLRKRLAGYT